MGWITGNQSVLFSRRVSAAFHLHISHRPTFRRVQLCVGHEICVESRRGGEAPSQADHGHVPTGGKLSFMLSVSHTVSDVSLMFH